MVRFRQKTQKNGRLFLPLISFWGGIGDLNSRMTGSQPVVLDHFTNSAVPY